MSPVDYVSKAVVTILITNHNNLDALNRNHNVINPALTTYQSLFDSKSSSAKKEIFLLTYYN